MKNDELLHKWVNGDLTAKELKTFKDRPEYESLKNLYQKTDHLSVPGFDEKEMLSSILAEEKSTSSLLGRRRIMVTWMKYAAAAAVLLLLGLFFWPQPNIITYAAARGEQIKGEFPNGSTFVLNAESTLAYDANNWENYREMELNGEAFFEVTKGRPFQVNTSNGVVKVLGTQFNVWSRHQTMEVQCKSGRVSVASLEIQEQRALTKNESIEVTNGIVSLIRETPANETASWTTGVSKFRNIALYLIIEELERQFNINIDASRIIADDIVTANFSHNNLESALKTSLTPFGIRYEMASEDKVVLFKE